MGYTRTSNRRWETCIAQTKRIAITPNFNIWNHYLYHLHEYVQNPRICNFLYLFTNAIYTKCLGHNSCIFLSSRAHTGQCLEWPKLDRPSGRLFWKQDSQNIPWSSQYPSFDIRFFLSSRNANLYLFDLLFVCSSMQS